MQQPNEMMNPPPLPLNITTEQIQKYLEENKQLILAIMENQNQGRAAESAMIIALLAWNQLLVADTTYQTQLQNNLLYLAKIADNQPQASQSSQPSSKVPSQVLAVNCTPKSTLSESTPPQPSMQEEHYIQPSHPAMSQQQQGFLALKSPFPLNDQQQQQQQQHQLSYVQQQQLIQAQMGMRPGAPTGIYQAMQSGPGNSFAAIQGSRQDGSEGGASDGTGR
ncbi:hypothetical protein JRO89_XS15G0014500 [Xanthoceras sorbifolium]|uniref:SS18 N-terminal domain-containing protein n=1 Tax=Xanthoceras sorbifolium TaxID=99658 RepID=A0ABQ8H0M3_9ROSI|nr:hypothetical protein JRO89_XS15G0014500 [Xanthoceras sorbifolium]